jgi:Ca-activated chloride channel family protein
MSFIWPQLLLSLALIPLGAAFYIQLGRRRRRRAAARGGLGLATTSAAGSAGPRSRIPAALLLAGFVVMCLALARPQGTVDLPHEEGTVILAFDVSGSMAADDLKPTRMDAAKAASQAFVQSQPAGVVIGVVAFSDSGLAVQAPTNDQQTILAAINRLAPQRGTALGQGISASLNAIQIADAGTPADYYSNRSPDPTITPAPVPAGSHGSAVIVLLTDGENNENPDPLVAAQASADQGVRIDTIGLGSAAGTTLDLNGFRVHTQLDAALLQQISQVTGGTYYSAENDQDLSSIYASLDKELVVKAEQIEVTSLFAGASVVMLLLGGLSSLYWFGRLP